MDRESALKFITAARESGLVAVDTETTGLKVRDGQDYCMGVSLAYRVGSMGLFSCYLPFRHPERSLDRELTSVLKDALLHVDLIFHNRKFDLHSLATLGIDLGHVRKTHYDTLLLAHMLNEDIPYSKSLESVGQHYLKEGKQNRDQVKKWGELWGWGNIPVDLMEPYAKQDAELTYKLWEHLWPRWVKDYDPELWQWEQDFNSVLYRMEKRGVAIDIEFCRKKAEIGYGIMADIEDVLGFNPGSSTQLGKYLIEELNMPILERSKKTEKPSFNKNVMEQYDAMLQSEGSQTAKRILEYRGWAKAVTALYDPMQKLVSLDGRIRSNFKQHGTKTGRLSCSDPNLQQLPRSSDRAWNGNARSAFSSGDTDYTLVSFDYSQLELRLAAAYGNEQILLEEFSKADADPFTRYAEILGEDRQTTKTFFYANIYEAGSAKIAYTLHRPVPEIEVLHKRFKNSIPGITNASNMARKLAEERKYVKLWTGRRRHYPFHDSKYYTAFNSVLQGGGAEVVKRSMVRIANELENDECFMLMQIHDEIVFAIRNDKIEHYKPLIIEIMERHPEFPIKLKVESKLWAK